MMLTTPILVMGAMAFFTLLERKFLGYSQQRKGPNKVSVLGAPQPLADAIKLFAKQQPSPTMANTGMFMLAPMINLWLAMTLWMFMPLPTPMYTKFSVLAFLTISSLSVYTIMGSGWTANSKFSLLGSLRAIAQTISYEVSMVLTLLSFLILPATFSLMNLQSSFNMLLMMTPLSLMWMTTALAETNRAPFDLAEGESELVSGFNTEYAASLFAFIFMAEYMNILFLAMMSATLMIQVMLTPYISLSIKTSILSMVFLATRTSFPRMRYDKLMNLTWTSFLPISLLLFFPVLANYM